MDPAKLRRLGVQPARNPSVKEYQRVLCDVAVADLEVAVFGRLTGGSLRDTFVDSQRRAVRRIIRRVWREARQ